MAADRCQVSAAWPCQPLAACGPKVAGFRENADILLLRRLWSQRRHSYIGALPNAHPNVVMSNELNALRRLRTGMTIKQLYRLVYFKSQRQVQRGSIGGGGYTSAVSGQWQGRHRKLTVIGNRNAGATGYDIVSKPASLEILDRKVKLTKKFIHVIRNPFDTITTTYHKTQPKPEEDSERAPRPRDSQLLRPMHGRAPDRKEIWCHCDPPPASRATAC